MKEQRQEELLDFISSKPYTSYAEIAERFDGVSTMTLRRDVESLAREGKNVRVRGGVKAINYVMRSADATFFERSQINREEKERIARAALGLVQAGQICYFDSGTTVFLMAELMENVRCWVYTSGLTTATALLKNPDTRVNVVGGLVSPDNMTSSGEDALRMVGGVSFDVAFIVPSGVSAADGFSCGNYHFAELKRLASKRSKMTVMLADDAKIDAQYPFRLFDFPEVDVLITSCRKLPPDIIRKCSEAGVEIVTV